jgi:O-antigen/teichoic acid export membrane protein
MWPLMIGLAVCAEPLVSIVLTDKWLPCVFFLRIYCITFAFYPIHTANLNAIKAMGRSDLFLTLEIIKKAVGFILLLMTMRISVEAMAYSLLANSIASQVINSWPNRTLLKYSYLEQIRDILPSVLLSAFMGAVVFALQFLPLHRVIILVIQVLVGACVYLAGSHLLHLETYEYMMTTAKGFLHRRG